MDIALIIKIIEMGILVVGGATVLFRTVAPFTKTLKDDKILKILEQILGRVALNKSDHTSTLEIKLKRP